MSFYQKSAFQKYYQPHQFFPFDLFSPITFWFIDGMKEPVHLLSLAGIQSDIKKICCCFWKFQHVHDTLKNGKLDRKSNWRLNIMWCLILKALNVSAGIGKFFCFCFLTVLLRHGIKIQCLLFFATHNNFIFYKIEKNAKKNNRYVIFDNF